MQTINETRETTIAPSKPMGPARNRWSRLQIPGCRCEQSGQAIVEFAIVSIAFFMIIFGTIDFGRGIYMYSQLQNAVREGARYGKIAPTDAAGVKQRVANYATALNISTSDVTVSCGGTCKATSPYIEVSATGEFRAITQEFLGISPIDLEATARVITE